MNTDLKKEAPVLIIALLPIAYLLFIWNTLPASVPMHWNMDGKIDSYGSKANLIWMSLLLPFLVYGILSVIPSIDPKGNMNKMGNKLQTLKLLLTTFMSLLALWILYATKRQSIGNVNTVMIIIGVLFIILGNYFKTIPPNYFMGIRTPWTLESEANWKETHKLGGKLWFAGGILIVILGFILDAKANTVAFISILIVICLIPVIYSYFFYRKQKKISVN